jgi:hypothetical protein
VPKHELLEQILAARFELDYASRENKALHRDRLFQLLDQAREGTNLSRQDLVQAIHDRYTAYRRERRDRERVSLAQKLRSSAEPEK